MDRRIVMFLLGVAMVLGLGAYTGRPPTGGAPYRIVYAEAYTEGSTTCGVMEAILAEGDGCVPGYGSNGIGCVIQLQHGECEVSTTIELGGTCVDIYDKPLGHGSTGLPQSSCFGICNGGADDGNACDIDDDCDGVGVCDAVAGPCGDNYCDDDETLRSILGGRTSIIDLAQPSLTIRGYGSQQTNSSNGYNNAATSLNWAGADGVPMIHALGTPGLQLYDFNLSLDAAGDGVSQASPGILLAADNGAGATSQVPVFRRISISGTANDTGCDDGDITTDCVMDATGIAIRGNGNFNSQVDKAIFEQVRFQQLGTCLDLSNQQAVGLVLQNSNCQYVHQGIVFGPGAGGNGGGGLSILRNTFSQLPDDCQNQDQDAYCDDDGVTLHDYAAIAMSTRTNNIQISGNHFEWDDGWNLYNTDTSGSSYGLQLTSNNLLVNCGGNCDAHGFNLFFDSHVLIQGNSIGSNDTGTDFRVLLAHGNGGGGEAYYSWISNSVRPQIGDVLVTVTDASFYAPLGEFGTTEFFVDEDVDGIKDVGEQYLTE